MGRGDHDERPGRPLSKQQGQRTGIRLDGIRDFLSTRRQGRLARRVRRRRDANARLHQGCGTVSLLSHHQAMAGAISGDLPRPQREVAKSHPCHSWHFFGDLSFGVGLLTTSTDVRAVGTGSVNGVPVTEYEGTYTAASGLAYMTANLGSAGSAQVSKQVTAMGLTTVRFRVWLDSQQRPLKLVLIEAGTHASVTVTQTIVSINQPANIQFPLASET